MVKVSGNKIFVETQTLEATIEKGYLISLKSKITGEEFIKADNIYRVPALELVYNNDEAFGIGEMKFGSVEAFQLSDRCAEIRFSNWDG